MYASNELQKWAYTDYPNPFLDPHKCSRTDPSYVCDPDKILNKEEADQLDFTIKRIRNDTSCICRECKLQDPGITVAIALMKSIVSDQSTTDEETTKNFAIHLRHIWNFGRCDDDVIVLVSSDDNQSYVAVGQAVSSVLSNELANKIFESSKNHFNNGYLYQGLESIIESYYDVLRQLQHSSKKQKAKSINNKGITIALVVSVATLVALLLFLGIILYRMKKRDQKANLRSNLTRWHNSKQIKAEDYKSCNTDDQDSISEGESLEDIDDKMYDNNQISRLYSITKRQLSAVLEESENDDDDENKSEERSRTLSFNQKSNINNIPRIPRFQHCDIQSINEK